MTPLNNNPLATTSGTGLITVTAPAHGYKTNDYIYMYGISTTAGIPANTLNGFHLITVIGLLGDTFSYEVNIQASATLTNVGGNTVQTGEKAPFQLLWGENSNTLAQNIGYPLEDSSESINTNIQSLQNFYQMTINTTVPTIFENNYTYINQTITIGFLTPTFIPYISYTITYIQSTNSFLVSVPSRTEYLTLVDNPQATHIKFGTNIYEVASYTDFSLPTFLVTCITPHNYNLSDINKSITLYNTADPTLSNDTSYDGDYIINNVLSTTTFLLPGVLGNINVHNNNIYGTISRNTPISTHTFNIANIIPDSPLGYILIETLVNHNLYIGDQIVFYNLLTSPSILVKHHTITSILTPTRFLIQFSITSIESILNSYIGTSIITVSFPSHNFNTITSIINTTTTKKTISTKTPHNFLVGDIVRLSNTQSTPSLDLAGDVIADPSDDIDTFTILLVTAINPTIPIWQPGNYPIIGLTNEFYLYGVSDVGGISQLAFNNKKFNIRDIIDVNTFTFTLSSSLSNATETGGGSSVFISSLKHGYNGIQTNTKNDILNRSISLEGENYVFLTCPTLGTIKNTGQVKDIFARFILDQSPGYMCNTYLSNPKVFNTIPLNLLSNLKFSIYYYNNTLYEFQDLDWSCTLEITEIIDQITGFNISSRRGIVDTA
jgi:hypothetical protein